MFSHNVTKIFREYQLLWATKNYSPSLPESVPPPISFVSLSYDVVLRNKVFAAAAICKSNNRKIIFATTQKIESINPTFGEAMAAKLAIKEVIQFNLKEIIIEGDS